jgi:AcrR family transcriptional regulator
VVERQREERRQAVSDHKRALILDAAREVFAAEGLEGASVRAIATQAGYTPAALYFHFDSKEAIYAELLHSSLAALQQVVDKAAPWASAAEVKLHAAAMAFFRFYAENPRDLDLGFYLFRGGMKPKGLGRERDELLNASLEAALRPIGDAAEALGATRREADLLIVDVFAHATGLLLLLHTGRIRMFGASALALMERYVHGLIGRLKEEAVR